MKIQQWAMLALASLGLNSATSAADNPHRFTVTAFLASDNVFRGMSQNDENPTPQMALDYEHAGGFYAGAWTAPVDYNDVSGANYEIDLYAGYKRSFGENFTADLQYIRYIYPDARHVDLDYGELIARLTFFQRALLLVGYSNDTFGSGYRGLYSNFSYKWTLPNDFTLTTGVGHYHFDERHFEGPDDYMDYNIGLGRTFGRIETTLSYIDTNERGDRLFGRSAGKRYVLLLKYVF